MVLTKEIQKKICDFVYIKPRTIQEISKHIDVNWHTADSYVDKIAQQEGVLATITFRGGTKGALKIAYWLNLENVRANSFKDRIFKQIESGKRKEDFSPSEIYQFVDSDKKKIEVLTDKNLNSEKNSNNFKNLLESSENQVLFFSGNLTFSNMKSHDLLIRNVVEKLALKNVSIKVLTRVEIPGMKNIRDLLVINDRLGKEMVEVRHCFQPLRLTIIDNKIAVFKEIFDPKNYAVGELKERIIVLYYIYDEEWITWLREVFWTLFRVSISAQKRIEDFKSIIEFAN
ncbi:MAG: hypothetical protein CVU81_01335 [Euryarchaeota archaeon HGW-Euryarchaeota-1]|nr:MAG: hypothetical protein CVU81_01335 [Euryarchaeota archaeon HGW-Euryarchaeota-1]